MRSLIRCCNSREFVADETTVLESFEATEDEASVTVPPKFLLSLVRGVLLFLEERLLFFGVGAGLLEPVLSWVLVVGASAVGGVA